MQRITSHLLLGLLLMLSAHNLRAQELISVPVQPQQADSLHRNLTYTQMIETQVHKPKVAEKMRQKRHICVIRATGSWQNTSACTAGQVSTAAGSCAG